MRSCSEISHMFCPSVGRPLNSLSLSLSDLRLFSACEQTYRAERLLLNIYNARSADRKIMRLVAAAGAGQVTGCGRHICWSRNITGTDAWTDSSHYTFYKPSSLRKRHSNHIPLSPSHLTLASFTWKTLYDRSFLGRYSLFWCRIVWLQITWVWILPRLNFYLSDANNNNFPKSTVHSTLF